MGPLVQPALAATTSQELYGVVGAKIHCPRVVADVNWRIRIAKKTLDSSLQRCYLHGLRTPSLTLPKLNN